VYVCKQIRTAHHIFIKLISIYEVIKIVQLYFVFISNDQRQFFMKACVRFCLYLS